MKLIAWGFGAFGLIVCLHAVASGCSSRAALDPARTVPDLQSATGSADCALIAEPGEPIETVALSDPIDPSHAPHPSNDSERLLFRQIYETLVRADCKGRVVPGLAASWRLDANGRTWILTLRENASFSDGTPVTAAGVRDNWSGGIAGELRPHVSRLVESVAVAGERDLAITLRNHRVDAPASLAHPELAIARSVTGSEWPLGTRSARVAPEDRATVITVARDNLSAIQFLLARRDPRDLLDDGVDLLVTRDPAALDYAATLPQFQSVPLAWQRIHVLLQPGRSRSVPSLSEDARQVLAEDAVRGEAQAARGPFWWQTVPDCGVALSPPRHQSSPMPRIVYDASDAAARDLAERFVGLGTYQRATGLTGAAWVRARRLGTDAGYVMFVDRRPVDPCRELQALLDSAPWLDPDTIVPLVETRLRAIVRRGRSGVTAEWDGGVLIAGASDAR